MGSNSDHENAVSVEDVSEEEAVEKPSKKGFRRSVAEGRFKVPPNWPSWKVRCTAVKRGRPCRNWAVVGMPTCRFHGSGGEKNRQLGQLRYLAWVTLGAPDNLTKQMPVEHAMRLALAMYAEYIFSDKRANDEATVMKQIKAAQWLSETARQ